MSGATTSAAGDPRTGKHESLVSRIAGSPALRLVARRLLIIIPLLFAVSVLVFLLMEALPGDPARIQAGMDASEEQVEAVRQQMGLDRPGYERYLSWLGGFFTGDLGHSAISGRAVTALLAERLPVTLQMAGMALALSVVMALPLALAAARKPGGVADRFVMVFSMTLLAVPNFVMALLLVLIFAVALSTLPAIGYAPLEEGLWPNLRSMILPVVSLAVPIGCFYARFLRGDLVEQLNAAAYIDTARAKGAGTWRILWLHAFRNSSFGLLTLVGLNVGGLVGGTVIIERIFAMPGMGMLMLEGVISSDVAVVQTCVLIFAAFAVIANLLVDVTYAVLDPRIRYGSH
ncbi:peptide/nickel transport system permease protein [Lipingzhangella halophila]|uniref:Peptide/nickel transport system permease protein n=1 Tax=Lipingzhangella halophila TaxID=1783352 RepID=A0A7W7W211_9ACTN|nr:ABC transporter permease [Lipingzhangella halophila]MBB4931246.1 peptide/nickel transport system permease protein [Lipingzhangella halophila]